MLNDKTPEKFVLFTFIHVYKPNYPPNLVKPRKRRSGSVYLPATPHGSCISIRVLLRGPHANQAINKWSESIGQDRISFECEVRAVFG